MKEERKKKLRGCIKNSRGPWIVHRTTKDGGIVTKYRFPSENEREKNMQRERKRRAVSRKIFEGLKQHGNYNLPKYADSNDLLKALCNEAGWHVEEDGTIYKKCNGQPSLVNNADDHQPGDHGDPCKSNKEGASTSVLQGHDNGGNDIKLSLSLSL